MGNVKINPGDFQEVDLADMFHKSENQSERLVHWQMTTLKFKSQMIFGQKCLVSITWTTELWNLHRFLGRWLNILKLVSNKILNTSKYLLSENLVAVTYLKVLNTKAIGGRNGDSPFIVGRPTLPLMYVVLYYVSTYNAVRWCLGESRLTA